MDSTCSDRISNPLSTAQLASWLLEDQLVILDLVRRDLFLYNTSAALIWLSLCERPSTKGDLASTFVDIYGLTMAQAELDTSTCLNEWVERGWISINSTGEINFLARKLPSKGEATRSTLARELKPNRSLFRASYCLHKNSFSLTLLQTEPQRRDIPHFLTRLFALLEGLPTCDDVLEPDDPASLVIVLDDQQMRVFKGADLVFSSIDGFEVLSEVMKHLFYAAYPTLKHTAIVHAAALRKQKTVLFAGVSGSGKSTLSAHLACHGWTYGGDDTVALGTSETDPHIGMVLPFPTAVSVKTGSMAVLEPFYPDLRSLGEVQYGGKTARFLPLPHARPIQDDASLELAAIVFPTFSPDATLEVTRLSSAEALRLLVSGGIGFNTELSSEGLGNFLRRLTDIPLYRMFYSDLREAQVWLDTLATK